jgi:hypothetical protein
MQTHLKNLTGLLGLQPLLYTEKDLPPSYFQDFHWAFKNPKNKGFWTWKPWILRNLIETLLQQDDLVLWVDSDRQIVQDDEATYLKVAICNMEHRNDNYAGIFPFERCMGHRESRWAKPETFVRMGLDAEVYGTKEQVYAGSLGFRVNQDTLGFFKEWESWGKVPVMFGDDGGFPSNPPPPEKGYDRHKNDQAVFSLMVHRHDMKVWPAPYYWERDSGVEECKERFQDAGYCFFFRGEVYEGEIARTEICSTGFEKWLSTVAPPKISS